MWTRKPTCGPKHCSFIELPFPHKDGLADPDHIANEADINRWNVLYLRL